ncbi:MAG: ribonuclease P protein component [Succinivibrio sp.]|jgi:ribonuclease P protein component|nr:ribonuclease P protein component [Succinivibrio sp.]
MTDNTFPREVRLLSSGDYDRVFNKCIRASVPGVLVLAHKDKGSGHARLGLVVPKKILKRAVWRNRVKRVIRETFRLSQASLPHADLIVIARTGIKAMSNPELRQTLLKLWDQISHRLPD